jgi:hypothetical protein
MHPRGPRRQVRHPHYVRRVSYDVLGWVRECDYPCGGQSVPQHMRAPAAEPTAVTAVPSDTRPAATLPTVVARPAARCSASTPRPRPVPRDPHSAPRAPKASTSELTELPLHEAACSVGAPTFHLIRHPGRTIVASTPSAYCCTRREQPQPGPISPRREKSLASASTPEVARPWPGRRSPRPEHAYTD